MTAKSIFLDNPSNIRSMILCDCDHGYVYFNRNDRKHTLPCVCQMAGVTPYCKRQHVTNAGSRAFVAAKLRGHVNIRNGHYALSTIRKTPVKSYISSMISVSIDISVITNNQETLPNSMFYKRYNTCVAEMQRINASDM